MGDGVSSCDLPLYQTKLTLAQPGTTVKEFDEKAFKRMLYTSGALPTGIDPKLVLITVTETDTPSGRRRARALLQREAAATGENEFAVEDVYLMIPAAESSDYGSGTVSMDASVPDGITGTGRHLLQSSGLQITVTIFSESQSGMSNVTGAINTTALQSTGFVVTQAPTNYVNPYQDGDEPTVTTSTGFKVTAVQFDDATSQWLVDVRYTSNVPNTITSLYVSKPGTALPYTQSARNTYYIAKHPCVIYNAVCCLSDYAAGYEVGVFKDNITRAIGTCNETVQSLPTLGMFNPVGNARMVENTLSAYPDSSVVRVSDNEVRLRIAQTDLSVGGLAMRSSLESNPAGYQLQFFVGMSFFTLLDANAMSVTATQTAITLSISNSISFSFASSQDYSLVKYITLSVMQNKWMDGFVERKMQFVQVILVPILFGVYIPVLHIPDLLPFSDGLCSSLQYSPEHADWPGATHERAIRHSTEHAGQE